MFNLIVTHEFGGYAVGERITDSDKMDAALASNAGHVVRVGAEPEVAPEEGSRPVFDASEPAPERVTFTETAPVAEPVAPAPAPQPAREPMPAPAPQPEPAADPTPAPQEPAPGTPASPAAE